MIINHLIGSEPECRTVEIDEHLECQCGCGKSQSECKSTQVCMYVRVTSLEQLSVAEFSGASLT